MKFILEGLSIFMNEVVVNDGADDIALCALSYASLTSAKLFNKTVQSIFFFLFNPCKLNVI